MRFTQNPINRAEFTRQLQVAGRRRRWSRWLGHAMTIGIFAAAWYSILTVIVAVQGTIPISYDFYGHRWEDTVMPFTVVWTFLTHFSVIFRTLGLSAPVISREHQGGTWDLLVLTGVDARQIVLGKWWAIIQRMRWSYFILGLMRATVLLWVIVRSYVPLYYNYANITPIPIFPRLLAVVFTLAFIVLLTFLNLGFTAACGLSASPDHRNGAVALARAIGTRFLVILGTVLIPVGFAFLFQRLFYNGNFSAPTVGIAFGLLTLVDNGLTMSYQLLVSNLNDYTYNLYTSGISNPLYESTLYGMFFAMLFYIVLTYAMLRFARWRAVKRGALPPLRLAAAKSA